jgi:hypothetical protein
MKAAARFVGDAELVDLRLDLDELRREHAAVQARVAVLEDRLRRTSGVRDEADGALLLAIAEHGAGASWTTRELQRHSLVIPALRAALRNADATSARRLGWLMRRLECCTINGLSVDRVSDTRDGIRWRVRVSRVS